MTTENSSGDSPTASGPNAATREVEAKPPQPHTAPIIRGETEAVVGGAGVPPRKEDASDG